MPNYTTERKRLMEAFIAHYLGSGKTRLVASAVLANEGVDVEVLAEESALYCTLPRAERAYDVDVRPEGFVFTTDADSLQVSFAPPFPQGSRT